MTKTKNAPTTMMPVNPAELEPLERIADSLKSLTTEQLREELKRGLSLTAEHLLRLALVIRELEDRGEDLSDLRLGMIGHLRRIAYGQTTPQVVVRFIGSPAVLSRITGLPMPDQERLGNGEPVRLIEPREEGPPEHRVVDPAKLTRDQIMLVFANDHIRDVQEQLNILQERRLKPVKRGPKKAKRVRADRERGGVLVGNKLIPQTELLEALAELASKEDEEPDFEEQTSPVPLTATEHSKLKHAAVDAGVSVTKLVRKALRATGLI